MPKMQQELFLPILSNLEKLFESKKDYDVIIKAGDDDDQKEIYAHSNILSCQSDYFDTAFSSNWAEKIDGKYLYCGQLDLNVNNGPDISKLLVATGELGLDTLGEYIQEFLIKQNDPIGILEVAFQHENFTTLRGYGLEAICQDPYILFGTDKILSLPAQILESLLKRDDLVLDEIEGTNKIVGGYNPLDWEGSGIFKDTQDSFVYIFNDYRDINRGKIGRVTDASHALICNHQWGPIFGYNYDIAMYPDSQNNKWYSKPNSYPNINIPGSFEIDDYEAFQVVKK
ncbi:unnamed protein product [Rhizophagus irregularis]|nr:unnamed protein product [Rhizophagus irregularis]